MKLHTYFIRVVFPIVALLFVGSPLIAHASGKITWEEEPQFHVEIGGKPDVNGKIYRPDNNSTLLLYISDQFKTPLLINLASKAIKKVSLKDLSVRDEYSYETKGVPGGSKVAKYAMKQGVSVFKYAGKTVSIRVKETLVGEVSEGIILAHSPEYAALRDEYKPNSKYVHIIKKYSKPLKIVVMFATWCPTCKRVVPRFLKIMESAANPNINIEYIGISMGGAEPHDLLEKYGHDYPGFIFFSGGKELGRIVGDPPVPLEQSIADILTRGK